MDNASYGRSRLAAGSPLPSSSISFGMTLVMAIACGGAHELPLPIISEVDEHLRLKINPSAHPAMLRRASMCEILPADAQITVSTSNC